MLIAICRMIVIDIYKDDVKLTSRSFEAPKTASQIKEALKRANCLWAVGQLVESRNTVRVYLGKDNVPPGTYNMNLQRNSPGLSDTYSKSRNLKSF